MHTHSPAEWAASLSLGVSGGALIALALAFADADPEYFDPRPAVRRIAAVLHQGAVHAGHDLNRAYATSQRAAHDALREAALTVAALLILTIPTGGQQ